MTPARCAGRSEGTAGFEVSATSVPHHHHRVQVQPFLSLSCARLPLSQWHRIQQNFLCVCEEFLTFQMAL